ncbi:amidase family protein [Natronogracilivirga saccharolytica]|uniref:amidase family protein n=1 Tax=Natronogracilivirga saccharolytica TaxID=2812953 RepID=UPI001FEAE44B|nr:amidase family protein [Natronogracilivirga saccharolytica]
MNDNTIRGIRDKFSSGDASLSEVVNGYLSVISRKNQEINAFTSVHADEAAERAEVIGKKIKEGTAGPLAGTVIGIKEVLCQKGYPATCASRMLENYEAVYDATVVRRLMEQDAVIVGRLNMDEFAMGSSTENTIHGPAKNPHNANKVTGGSSGGSAAAVAADMCSATLGTDTGGSIRQPASYCGVVGLKPSYGRVSRYGLIAYASSFDSIGPLTHNVSDAATILKAIAGHDPSDATSSSRPVPDYPALLENPEPAIKIGIPDEYFGDGLDPVIRERVMDTARNMEKKGAELVSISLPHLKYAIATYYILATAEASSNLARFDGIRYGHRADIQEVRKELKNEEEAIRQSLGTNGNGKSGREKLDKALLAMDSPMIRLYKKSRTEGFGTEVKRRIMLGTYVLSAGYYDAYYGKAQRIRRLIKQDFQDVFSKVDVIISPTAPTTAFDLGSKVNDPLQMYLNDIYTISANLAGICGINVPAGLHSDDGLPIGVQFMADAFDEPGLLNAARIAEQALAG